MSDFNKTKNFCSVKDTVKKMKQQATDWEKEFAKHMSNKGLLSKIYKELFNIRQQEKEQSSCKMGKRSKQPPHQKDTHMAYKDMK